MSKLQKTFARLLLCFLAVFMISAIAIPAVSSDSHNVFAASSKSSKTKTPKNGFYKKNGRWYYYKDGKKQTGWITVGKRVYYGQRKGTYKGALRTGWTTIKGKLYYFRTSGKKKVVCSMYRDGTYKVNGISCVFNEDGTFKKYKYAGRRVTFTEKIGEMARDAQAKYNILASIMTAQACLETGYGRYISRNNLFGISNGVSYKGYSSWEASVSDYINFMRTYIPRIFGVRNWYTACVIIGRSGYAQAGNYTSALISVTSSNNLTRFNR